MHILKAVSYFTRILSLPVGLVLIWYGVITFIEPQSDDVIEIINSSCAVIMGLYFIFYGVTGRGNVRKNNAA